MVSENGTSFLPQKKHTIINHFHTEEKKAEDFEIKKSGNELRVIEALDGQLITNEIRINADELSGSHDLLVSNIEKDILKITVVNRYRNEKPSCAFIHGFGLNGGAIAGTVAHDSHNIIAVGCTDEEICRAVNAVIRSKGCLCVVQGKEEFLLPLPVAGLMSDTDCMTTGQAYSALDKKVKSMGCALRAPFMTLSFMALLVIPSLKLSDKGLFDVTRFSFA
jgi:adenine deaminase